MLRRWRDRPRRLLRRLPHRVRQLGQGMTEYAFILTLVALVLILIVTVIGRQTNNLYSNITSGLNQ